MTAKERSDVAPRFTVVGPGEAHEFARDRTSRFRLRVPGHWRSPVSINPNAVEAETRALAWLAELGCSPSELRRAQRFDTAGLMGIPFPHATRESAIRLARCLALWVLWDDVQVESLEDRWRIDSGDVLENRCPEGMHRFDQGWWQLLCEYAARRSRSWIEGLCSEMMAWNEAAVADAVAVREHLERGVFPEFARQLEIRTAGSGIYAVLYLMEDAYGYELPRAFHWHTPVVALKKLANEIMGIGNDIFSLGKDLTVGHLNLVSTLAHEQSISHEDALARVIRMHDDAIRRFDELAAEVGSWGATTDLFVQRWLDGVRYACLGFSIWAARAPRYTAHKLVSSGRVIEPVLEFVERQ